MFKTGGVDQKVLARSCVSGEVSDGVCERRVGLEVCICCLHPFLPALACSVEACSCAFPRPVRAGKPLLSPAVQLLEKPLVFVGEATLRPCLHVGVSCFETFWVGLNFKGRPNGNQSFSKFPFLETSPCLTVFLSCWLPPPPQKKVKHCDSGFLLCHRKKGGLRAAAHAAGVWWASPRPGFFSFLQLRHLIWWFEGLFPSCCGG